MICSTITHQLEHGEDPHRLMPPGMDEVHLWRVNLEIPSEQLAELRRLLSPDEMGRADAFLQPEDRSRYTVTRGACAAFLAAMAIYQPRKLS